MADGEEPNDNPDEPKKGAAAPPTNLDDVHEQIQNERSDELHAPDPNEDIENDADDPDEPEDEPEEPVPADPEKPDDKEDEPEPPEPEPADDDTPEDEPEELRSPERGDTDTSKPGKYKAQFTDEEGNVYHVNDMDELPDDFEPRSQKDYGKSIQDLTKKQLQADADQKEYAAAAAERDREKAITNLKTSWNNDIERLTKDGTLPKDSKEREKVVAGVYDLMSAEMKNGNTIDSWAIAHRLYKAEQIEKQQADDEKTANNDKKTQGNKVMGGGSDGAPHKSKIMEGPPPGIGLDAVHERVMNGMRP